MSKKVVSDKHFWVAFVICYNPHLDKMVGSVISFWARNKFIALRAVSEQLPDNSQYLDEHGKLLPYTLLELRHAHPNDVGGLSDVFTEFFVEMIARGAPVTRHACDFNA